MTRRYPAYQDSGVEWLGELPAHWNVKPLRRLVINSNAGEVIDRSFWGGDSELLYTCALEPLDCDYEGFPDWKRTKPMDLLLTRNGTPYVHKPVTNAIYTNVVQRVTLCADENRDYCAIAFQNSADNLKGYGVSIESLNYEMWKALPIPVPPVSEQTAIAAFLDRETAKIDALVAEQQRLIDLLKEKRQAVISHAVTRGLNPDAKLKPSGVDWLGDVPEWWEVMPLKRITLERCDGPFGSGLKSEHYVDDGTLVVRLQNIKSDGFFDGEPAFIDSNYASNELGRHEVIGGDLLIAGLGDERNLVGRACVAPTGIEPAMVKADCFRFRLDQDRAQSTFIAYQLNASAAYDAGTKATGTTRARIPLSEMAERAVALPSLAEQDKIIAHLSGVSTAFNELSATAEAAIALLQERRAALISAAVTGKIDVRDHIPQETEAA